VIDPHPQMTLEYALKLLRHVYGADYVVHWPVSKKIVISANDPSGGTASVTLTIEQAKYLAAHPLSIQDLIAERYPVEWPTEWR
jgi:hypothetical protein